MAKDGVLTTSDGSQKVTYAELVGGNKFELQLNPGAKRKHPSQWSVLGKSIPRVELPEMVTGRFEYAHNVRVPGMLHGRVVRPPAYGATVISVDENSVKDMATDVIVPGRSLDVLRNAALSMKAGGVGYYPSQFVHIDVGRVRKW